MSRYAWNCKDEDGNTVVAVGIDGTGGLHLLCAHCLADVVRDDGAYSDLTADSIQGTHILSPRALDELYGTDR